MLTQVSRLSAMGFALHWLHPKSKRPIGDEWSEKPFFSAAELRSKYREGNNLGVRPGELSQVGGGYMHIIDMDIRQPEFASVAKAKLTEVFPELDYASAVTVLSGSGGESRHFYFLADKPFSSTKFAHSEGFSHVWDEAKGRDVKKWDWELHLLGTGANAVVPPSIHDKTGQPYRWLRSFDADDLDLGLVPIIPAWVVQRVTGYQEQGEIDPERLKPLGLTLDEIREYLDELDHDEWCEDRDGWFRAGMAVHHETGGSPEGLAIWDQWSKKGSTYNPRDCMRVWRSFKKDDVRPFRMASIVALVREERHRFADDNIEDDFDDQEPEAPPHPLDSLFDDILGYAPAKKAPIPPSHVKLRKSEVNYALGADAPAFVKRMNKSHGVARVKGRTVVMDFHDDGSVSYGSVNDLHNFYENDRRAKDGEGTEPVSKAWMRDKARRSYPGGIVFSPNSEVAGAYNHWQGFSIEPSTMKRPEEGCKLWINHLSKVICGGNAKNFWYALRYWAHMVQFPEEKPGVAFVVKGKKGAGKDTIAEYFSRIVAHHYITIANKDQLVGKFNSHQEKTLLLHVQEAFWGGDKRDEGPLKYLITSPNVMIEPKGMNAFSVLSVLRLFLSSNEKWVVPASEDERRYFVLNVSNVHRRDHTYFKALREEMNGDGPACLLAYLLSIDLSDFEVRDVPDTEALAEQKVEGLKNVERWWHGILQHGSIDGVHQNTPGVSDLTWGRGTINVGKADLMENYERWMSRRRFDGEVVSEIEFGRRLKVMVPSIMQKRPRNNEGQRPRTYILPDLSGCRGFFEAWLGSELPWPEEQVAYTNDIADSEMDDMP